MKSDTIFKKIKAGEVITKLAGKQASGGMSKMVAKFSTPGAREEALDYHALYIGIGTQFMETIVPLVQNMSGELRGLASAPSEEEARILVGFFVAKVFMSIQDQVEEHEVA